MIDISFTYSPEGILCCVEVRGHAGFSDSEHGGDVVCSAVSALVGFLGLTFSEILTQEGRVRGDDGYFELVLTNSGRVSSEVGVLLQGWALAVAQLEENYRGWVKLHRRTTGEIL